MAIKFSARLMCPVVVSGAVFAGLAAAAVAMGDPLPYGPDTCVQGYVWREAIPNDHVCVTPAVRARTQQENGTVAERRDPTGAYGSNTCKQGFVWREAFDGDVVCVTPDIRSATKADNAAAASRVQPASQSQSKTGGQVRFELTGSGTADTIDIDPGGRIYGATAPWGKSVSAGSGDSLLQMVVVVKDGSLGCRITLDGKVVNEQPAGQAPHCIYERS